MCTRSMLRPDVFIGRSAPKPRCEVRQAWSLFPPLGLRHILATRKPMCTRSMFRMANSFGKFTSKNILPRRLRDLQGYSRAAYMYPLHREKKAPEAMPTTAVVPFAEALLHWMPRTVHRSGRHT